MLAFLFALGIRSLGGQVRNGGSALHSITGLVGTGVSAGFLYLIAALNIAVLLGIIRGIGRAASRPVTARPSSSQSFGSAAR